MAMAQRGRLFLWLPVWLGVGIGIYDALPFEPASWLAALFAGIALLCVILAWRIAGLVPAAPLLLLPAGFVLFGFAAAQFDTARKPRLVELPRRASQIEGNVQAVDLLPDGGRRLTLRDVRIGEDESLPRLLRIAMQPDDPVTPDVGDHVRTKALLQLPLPPSWPGGRDAQFESFYDDVGGAGRALGLVEDLGGGQIGVIAQLRRDIDARVMAELPGSEGGIAATLMAGAGGAISRQDRADFAASGLAHILAVAGLHLATVMGLVFGVVRLGLVLVPRWGLILPCKQIAAVASLLAGFGYMLLTGAHVPAERSFVMACLVVLAVLAGRRVISLRGLALAAMAVLLIAPDALVGVSFQMSFSAVLALIVGYRAIQPWLLRMQAIEGAKGWLLRHFVMLGVTSFLAGTATLPFAAASFGQIQIYYVLANLLAVPVTVVVVMPMAVLALLLMPVGASFPALWVMGKGIAVILWVARTVAGWPAAVLPWPPTPAWGLIAVASGIVLLGLLADRVRWVGLVPLAVGIASPFVVQSPDFLFARDARAMAWREARQVYVWQANSGAKYEVADWQRVWPGAHWQPMQGCDNGICRLRQGRVILVSRAESVDCTAKLILSAVPLDDACKGTAGRQIVDRFDVWRNGAYAGWWRNGRAELVSDHSRRGARPWVPVAGEAAATANPVAASE